MNNCLATKDEINKLSRQELLQLLDNRGFFLCLTMRDVLKAKWDVLVARARKKMNEAIELFHACAAEKEVDHAKYRLAGDKFSMADALYAKSDKLYDRIMGLK